MKIDKKGKVLSFSEKPRGDDLKAMVIVIPTLSLITTWNKHILTYMLTLLQTPGSRYNSFGTFCGGGSKKAIHCFDGSVCLQEGDTSESSQVLII